ncbi:hypothetical protein GCM10022243_48310 [Saccharothrix violaceirubra]|uniref:Uncharacterized protein n=1 Tax=Saccharothrix violaceirubra TaxID=413306 RepID=A0A7W7WUH7_9PSEU|nr:hypothetical protein [Saccharothrix violaceirubra]MBB4963827.1 hypothetical protein [Saccharothrix violaceirubra]
MSDLPRNLVIRDPGEEFTFRIGDHDLTDLPIAQHGPIIENLTPGHANPLYRAWVPFMVEGTIEDPQGLCRLVHDGEAELVGLPSGEQELTLRLPAEPPEGWHAIPRGGPHARRTFTRAGSRWAHTTDGDKPTWPELLASAGSAGVAVISPLVPGI